jgi:hypothetical protein
MEVDESEKGMEEGQEGSTVQSDLVSEPPDKITEVERKDEEMEKTDKEEEDDDDIVFKVEDFDQPNISSLNCNSPSNEETGVDKLKEEESMEVDSNNETEPKALCMSSTN